MNRIGNTCNIEIDVNNYLKDRTVCKNCYNKNRRKKNKIDKINCNNDNNLNVSTNENHAYVVIGPGNLLHAQNTRKKGNQRPIHIITTSII